MKKTNLLLAMALLGCIAVPFAELPPDAFGWLLVVALTITSAIVPWPKTKSTRAVLVAALVLHHGIAFIHAYAGPVIGADADAIRFDRNATWMSNLSAYPIIPEGLGAQTYVWFVGLVYRLAGASTLLGCELSISAVLVSSWLFVALFRTLHNRDPGPLEFALYALAPSAVPFTSTPLRESFQVVFLLSACLSGALILKHLTALRLGAFLLSVVALAALHNGLAVYGLLLTCLVAYSFTRSERRSAASTVAVILFFVACTAVWFALAGSLGGASAAVVDGDVGEYAERYRSSSLDARAAYGIEVDASSLVGLLRTYPIALFYYFAAPLPWQASAAVDALALVENVLRLALIFAAALSIREQRSRARRLPSFLLIAGLLLECLWAMGTVNWGTAIRHHLVAYPLFVLLGSPKLCGAAWKQQRTSARRPHLGNPAPASAHRSARPGMERIR